MPVVTDFTALLSGYSWSGANSQSNAPAFVTYSFDVALPPTISETGTTQAFADSFLSFTEAEKAAARAALQQWGDACGLVFLEVDDSRGDIAFGSYDFSLDPGVAGFAGYAYYANTDVVDFGSYGYAYRGGLGGDVFISHGYGDNIYLLLHEIGHALGLKHPFEGTTTLDPAFDDHSNTVMSYTGSYPEVLGSFDLQAAVYLYGDSADDGSHVLSWSWNSASETLTQNGFGVADRIFGTGSKDVIYGRNGDDVLAGFQSDDTIYGGNQNDLLIGNEGNDFLSGQNGEDYLFGESGDDILNGSIGADDYYGGTGRDRCVSSLDGSADAFYYNLDDDVDVILNYEQGIDYLFLDFDLWDGGMTAAQVVAEFGSINATGTQITLNFGAGDVIRIKNAAGDLDLAGFANDLFF